MDNSQIQRSLAEAQRAQDIAERYLGDFPELEETSPPRFERVMLNLRAADLDVAMLRDECERRGLHHT